MRKMIIKEGPLVFLRNVVVMEIIASIFFVIISYLGNYELLFRVSAKVWAVLLKERTLVLNDITVSVSLSRSLVVSFIFGL
jgi:hypothetical protein